jgi:UDP-N-acetylglucosamine 1-carboxyvinyltransferase
MTLMQLGQQIKTARKAEGLTQSQLAEKIGNTKESVSRIETGRQNITYEMLEKIAQALNRTIADPILIKR